MTGKNNALYFNQHLKQKTLYNCKFLTANFFSFIMNIQTYKTIYYLKVNRLLKGIINTPDATTVHILKPVAVYRFQDPPKHSSTENIVLE